MRLHRLWLTDFRNYDQLAFTFDEGLTAIVGPNGVGKTNLLEAIGLLATAKSFRGAGTESLIRQGAEKAIIRAEGERGGRPVLIELELAPGGSRAQVNRQRLKRTRELLGAMRVGVFAPDDLALVKEGPARRREFIDELAVALDPRRDATLSDYDRVLRQRNALLRQSGGRLDDAAGLTLDVWDDQMSRLGSLILSHRYEVLERLVPLTDECYRLFAGADIAISAHYRTSWVEDSLAEAIAGSRPIDIRRGVSTVGPHRDELTLTINRLSSRTEASQGEQRTLALALRLAGHRLVTEQLGEPPLLLLDDVLSELDPGRARALLSSLPTGQVVLTSAADLPSLVQPDSLWNYDAAAQRGGGFVRQRIR